jgi:phosphoacetylglucosamine mutase
MFKVKVHDRSMFKTIKDESRLTEPLTLQTFIDKAVSECGYGRAFVRPSGTEDVLRLYVEAGTYHDVDAISNSILMEIDSKYRIA